MTEPANFSALYSQAPPPECGGLRLPGSFLPGQAGSARLRNRAFCSYGQLQKERAQWALLVRSPAPSAQLLGWAQTRLAGTLGAQQLERSCGG